LAAESALNWLNQECEPVALKRLLGFCHSRVWAQKMLAARPFDNVAMLLTAADRCWQECGREDYLEAFAAHPRIGDRQALAQKLASQVDREQGQVSTAPAAILDALAAANDRYYQRFGFIFIVCASGKSAQAMLDLLHQRLPNPPEQEMTLAAEEQRRITALRLQQWLEEFDG
jgi:2-oxo-4-hydroxy-4-carboxy-5-ureidoimidazoline decarboxylase